MVLRNLEDKYLDEPDERENTPKCEKCGDYPTDDLLYDTERGWLCADCVLGMYRHKDIYLGEW